MVVAPVVLLCHLCAGTPSTFFFARTRCRRHQDRRHYHESDWLGHASRSCQLCMGYLPAISLSSRPSKCMFPWSTNFQTVCGKLEILSYKTDPLRALTTQLNYWLQDEYNIWRDSSALSTLTIKHGTWCAIWMEIRAEAKHMFDFCTDLALYVMN